MKLPRGNIMQPRENHDTVPPTLAERTPIETREEVNVSSTIELTLDDPNRVIEGIITSLIVLKDWAIILAGLGMKHKDIAHWLGTYKGQIDNWLFGENIPNQEAFILNQEGTLISNSGIKIKNE